MPAAPKRPPPLKPIYIQTSDGTYHEMYSNDRPIKWSDGRMGALSDTKPGDEIEVFMDEKWQRATVQKPPKVYDFSVSCVSFESENEVWKALEKAVTGVYALKPNSPIPWLKITPPSRKPGGPDGSA